MDVTDVQQDAGDNDDDDDEEEEEEEERRPADVRGVQRQLRVLNNDKPLMDHLAAYWATAISAAA